MPAYIAAPAPKRLKISPGSSKQKEKSPSSGYDIGCELSGTGFILSHPGYTISKIQDPDNW